MTRTERRAFYRVNDVVQLSFAKIVDSMEQPEQQADDSAFLLPDLLGQIDDELEQLHRTLRQTHPVLSQALALINQKIGILARCQPSNDVDLGDTAVSISAGGLAFSCHEAMAPGSMLWLALSLDPHETPMRLLGRVVACEPRESLSSGNRFWLRVEFSDPDRELRTRLSQHILRKRRVSNAPTSPMQPRYCAPARSSL